VAQSVNTQDRFNNPSRKCPICSGWERGNPQCKGYLGERPGVVFCTSSDYAGILVRGDTGTFRHWTGPQGCKCGVSHLPSTNNSNHSNHYYYSKPKAEPMINHDGRPKTVEETYPYGDGCFVDRVLTGYTKEDGKPEKTFQQYQVIDGKKVYQGFKKLYRLDEVKASGKGFYFLVEGERKVNKLWEMDFPATCNVGGSGSWADNYADELPQGATAYIWPDNDDAGLKWTDKIISSLSTRKIKWHVLNGLTVGLPHKGDVMDWVKLPGNDASRLQAELDKFAPAKTRYSADELDLLPPVKWLLEPYIQDTSINLFSGESGAGKTFIAMHWSMSVASVYNVLYIAAEDPTQYPERVKAWVQHYRPEATKIWFETCPFHLLQEETVTELIKNNQDIKPRLVVIDTYHAATEGANEIDNGQIGLILGQLRRFVKEWECAVLIVHHFDKGGNWERGGSALKAGCQQALRLFVEGDGVKLTFDKTRNTAKPNDEYFRFAYVDVQINIDGMKITRSVRVPETSETPAIETKLNPPQMQILTWMGHEYRRKEQHANKEILLGTGLAERTLNDSLSKLKHQGYVEQTRYKGPYKITNKGLDTTGYGDISI
jgi:predicted transcriptional regulator